MQVGIALHENPGISMPGIREVGVYNAFKEFHKNDEFNENLKQDN